MTDLTPALSAEQWNYKLPHLPYATPTVMTDDGDGSIVRAFPGQLAVFEGDEFGDTRFNDGEIHALIALANHALPDGHAGKFTWADVELIARAADMLPEMDDALNALASRVAALLPPR